MKNFDPFNPNHTVQLMNTLKSEGFPTELFSAPEYHLHHLYKSDTEHVTWARHQAACEAAVDKGAMFATGKPQNNADVTRRLNAIDESRAQYKKPLSMDNWENLCLAALKKFPLPA